jgi:hypothetical protein
MMDTLFSVLVIFLISLVGGLSVLLIQICRDELVDQAEEPNLPSMSGDERGLAAPFHTTSEHADQGKTIPAQSHRDPLPRIVPVPPSGSVTGDHALPHALSCA